MWGSRVELTDQQKPIAEQADSGEASTTVHGGLLLAFLAIPFFLPEFQQWPWYLLVPLSTYLLVVALVSPLRRSVRWNRLGRLRGSVLLTTGAVIVTSSSALLLYDAIYQPDLAHLARQLPLNLSMHVAVVGVLFSVFNALLEEMIFRGILLDALTAAIGASWAVVVQALAFGVGHAHGYPPGPLGIALAAVYGLMLGLVRQVSGGLAAPWMAHVFADATIFWIVVTAVRTPS
jgi:membrane protease YdiL (CAAX protease family)